MFISRFESFTVRLYINSKNLNSKWSSSCPGCCRIC